MATVRPLLPMAIFWLALLGQGPGHGDARAAVVIDVVAETRLDLQVSDTAARLEVNGRLVDNTARGIPFREVVVSVAGASAHEETLLTDRFGRFYLELDAPFGPHLIRATYEGEPYLTAATEEVEVEIPPLTLELAHEPPPVHRPGARIVFEAQVSDSHGPVGRQPAIASSDCQPELLPSVTDGDGRLSVVVIAPAGRVAGACAIRVQLPETRHRAEYSGLIRVPVADSPSLEVERSREALRARVVAGHERRLPVEGVHVRLLDVTAEEVVEQASGMTSPMGEIEFAWPDGDAEARLALAMRVVDVDGTPREVRSEVFGLPGVRLRRTAAMAAGVTGSALTLFLLVLLVLDWRRARPAAPQRPDGSGAGLERHRHARPPVVPRVDRRGRLGMVIDADTRAPVAEAVVSAEAGGERSTRTDAEGHFDRMHLDSDSQVVTPVRVEASGYRSWEGQLEGRFPVVSLVSHRRDVLASYARALDTAASLRREAWWGKLSIHDVRDRGLEEIATLRRTRKRDPVVAADLRGVLAELEGAEGRARLVLALEALALLTDRSLFRPVAVDEEVIEVARKLEAVVISGVRDEQDARGGPS